MGQRSSRTQLYYSQAMKLLDNAILDNDADSLRQFLHEGVFTKEDLDEWQLLHHAAMLGHIDCVQELLHRGASVSAVDSQFGMTPLHFAAMAEEGSSRVIFELLQYGAKLGHMGDDQCRRTALHVAIEQEAFGPLRALIQYGCSVNVVSECEKGISPLLLAAQYNSVDIFKALLVAGADLRKCWIWQTSFGAPLDLITHRMSTGQDNVTVCTNLFETLLQADGNLYMTLCLMPQGQQTKVGAVRTFSALKTIVQRLDKFHRKQAQEFLFSLIMSGYKPRGESVSFLEEYDLVTYGLVKQYMKSVVPLKHLCVRVIRKHAQRNVLYTTKKLEKLPDSVLSLIRMVSLPQPNLLWM